MTAPAIAVLGLGEAGRLYARGLGAAGARVCGYDASPTVSARGIRQRRARPPKPQPPPTSC